MINIEDKILVGPQCVKMDLQEVECGGMDGIELAQITHLSVTHS
jgi:hypothetical protein